MQQMQVPVVKPWLTVAYPGNERGRGVDKAALQERFGRVVVQNRSRVPGRRPGRPTSRVTPTPSANPPPAVRLSGTRANAAAGTAGIAAEAGTHSLEQIATAAPGAALLGQVHPVGTLEGGIRRGADIVKTIALGADAVVIGRLASYGLAAAGQAGVERVLELLRNEVTIIVTLLGRGGLADLDGDSLIRESSP